MKQLLILVFISFFSSFILKAQTAVEFQNAIPVSTVAPDAASLGKFGNIPVSYATGIPSVNIPIYEINIGKIKIPLSLDYHGGGVRVDEVSSSVGTSWALSGIGMISRNMIGMPDENSSTGYLYAPSLDSLYNYYLGYSYGSTKDQNFSLFMYNIRDQLKDTEPDVFSYTLNGSSGKFIYRPNGSIMQIPVTNNRIERLGANNFKITDENGMVYIFDQQEMTTMVSQGANGPGTYISAWRLSRMIDPSLVDTVSFNYTSSPGDGEHIWNYSYTLCSATSPVAVTSGENTSVQSITHPTEFFPKEIDWRGGKITFANFRDRQDRTTELRLDSVNVYSKTNGTFQLIKSVKLFQSYFYSNPVTGKTADNRNYRLRLDSVAFLPVNSTLSPQKYIMTYNNSPIAPNESYGQDIWGYNNGQFNNASLMPKQTVLFQNVYQTIGEANMDPDSTNTYIEACMLQSIQYPTKGKSVFTFEPHRYPLNYQSYSQQSVTCNAYGGSQSTTTTSFTVSGNQTGFSYQATLSAYSFPGTSIVISNRPQIQMIDQTTGQQIFLVNNVNDPTHSFSTNVNALTLTIGHTYVITTNIYTSDTRVSATCNVSWSIPVSGTLTKTGGGLRVSSITNYDNNSNFINKETYQYGNNGLGTLLTDAVYLQLNYEYVNYAKGVINNANVTGNCVTSFSSQATIYHNKSIYPATQFSGTPVVYNGVTKFDTDISGNTNGKSLFVYNVYGDYSGYPETDYGHLGVLLISNPWRNGFMRNEYDYKSTGTSFTPVSIKQFNYQVYRPDTLYGLKIKALIFLQSGSCEIYNDTTQTRQSGSSPNIPVHFFESRLPTYTGAMLLQNESDTTFDNVGNKTVLVKNNYYDDLTTISPTRKEVFNSNGDDVLDSINYPHSLAATGNVYQTMINRNMIAPIVRYTEKLNGNQQTLTNINYYDWFGNGNLLLPQSVNEQVLANTAETRVNFNQYDTYGNILQQQKTNGPYSAYQWGYYKQYPVATAKNAKVSDIFFDSFEEGDGTSTLNDSKTGHYSHTGTYFKALTGLDPGSYILSYWQESAGSWSLVTTPITISGSTYNISLNTQIDDIRFYPVNAQMATFTYDPLIGMTSSTDTRNEVIYYEYDGFQRLINVKDKDGNIIKHMDYHFQGQ